MPWDRHDIDRHNSQVLASESHLDPDNGLMYSPTEETTWEPTNDGKGSWRKVGDLRCVIKEQESQDWWWGVYEDDGATGESSLLEEGECSDEAEARERADEIAYTA